MGLKSKGKQSKLWLTAWVTVVCIALMLAGCGNAATDTGTGGASASPSPGQEVSKPYVVKHAMGETPIEATPKRVVVLTNEAAESLLSLGVKPVGSTRAFYGDVWYPHMKKEMEGVTDLGTEQQPNIEAIASLKPDLIIGNKLRQEKVYDQLSKIAPTVFSETLRAEWQNNYKLYAEAVNKKAEGEKVLASFDKRVQELKDKAGDKLNQKASVVRFMPGKVRIYYNDTFPGVLFKKLGIQRPDVQNKEEFMAEVSKERIPEMEGDILFYFTYETGNQEASKLEQEWTNDPLWKNLNVVKAGKVHKVDDVVWTTAGGVMAANLLLDDMYKYFDVK